MFLNDPFHSQNRLDIQELFDRLVRERKREVRAALPALLAVLPEQADTLTGQQWEILYCVLNDRSRAANSQLKEDCLLVLEGLQKSADTAKLLHLDSWANIVAKLWATEEGAIAEAASRCLPLLHARINRETFRTNTQP